MIICRNSTTGFTLLELLIVIGILAVLMGVTVLVLEPGELLQRSRDAARIADLKNIDHALTLYREADDSSFGDATKVYVSLSDSSATCANLALPGLPSGYSYVCRTPANYQKTDGAGWVPINFTIIAGGSPLSSLPIDPSNSASGNLFYSYAADNRKWELTAQLESKKFNKGGEGDRASKDGGDDPNVYEAGTQLTLNPLAPLGYWAFDEGSGTAAGDSSKNGYNGTLVNGPAWATGKIGAAVNFDGINDYVSLPATTNFGPPSVTILGWVKNNAAADNQAIASWWWDRWGKIHLIDGGSTHRLKWQFLESNGSTWHILYGTTAMSANNWYYFAVTFNKTTTTARLYINGQQEGTESADNVDRAGGFSEIRIAGDPAPGESNPFSGLIDELRIYNRALSADEIKYYYNISK